ncbi:hypothetical protein [Shewanella algae]|uniref:hypothetical protein n=1 Tax=Shewanella algae TaxID=38313 RepID=UPI001187422E|nr:hypothetical protein [Shewanella algae]MDL2196917.1 hypothetical protein [Shewanella algae]TVO91988.1 hypothetical protein AYI86_20375 [Shewanella algae]
MKLHWGILALAVFNAPLVFAGQEIDTNGATQTQLCFDKLTTATQKLEFEDTAPEVKQCFKTTDKTKQITINCPASGTTNLSGIDTVKQGYDRFAIQMLQMCLTQAEQAGATLTDGDKSILKTLGQGAVSNNSKNYQGRWLSSFELGYKQQNSYNEAGERSGFDQGGVTASFMLNGRWQNAWGWNDAVTNFEVGVLFEKSPTVTEKKPNFADTSFNDVTDSIDGYLKFLWSPGGIAASNNGDSVLSLAILTGVRSLDEAKQGNELARYYGGGLEFNLYSDTILRDQNALPRAKVGGYFLRTTNYSSLSDINFFRISAQFQLVENKPFLVGFDANLGPDDLDDYSVTFSIRQNTEDLLKFFGFMP